MDAGRCFQRIPGLNLQQRSDAPTSLFYGLGAAWEVSTSGRPGKPDKNRLTRVSETLKNLSFPAFFPQFSNSVERLRLSVVQTQTLASFFLRYVPHLNFKQTAAHMITALAEGGFCTGGGGGDAADHCLNLHVQK